MPGGSGVGFNPSRSVIVVFKRKSWVTAIPIEANAREVRSQARKVRSEKVLEGCYSGGIATVVDMC